MKATPLLAHEITTRQSASLPFESVRDAAALDDYLPAVLDRNASGYVLCRATYVTEVKRETQDDN